MTQKVKSGAQKEDGTESPEGLLPDQRSLVGFCLAGFQNWPQIGPFKFTFSFFLKSTAYTFYPIPVPPLKVVSVHNLGI